MKTIYIEPDEEITSIIDMLSQSQAREIALIVPAGAQLLQSSINMKLLRREADFMRKKITIVTADSVGQEMAKKLNFTVTDRVDPDQVDDFSPEFAKVGADQKTDILDALVEEMEIDQDNQLEPKGKSTAKSKKMNDILRPKNKAEIETKPKIEPKIESDYKLFTDQGLPEDFESFKELGPFEGEEQNDKIKQDEAIKINHGFLRGFFTNKFLYFFIGLIIIIAGASAYIILPSAEVFLYSKTEKVTFDFKVEGSKDISQLDIAARKIPIQSIKALETLTRKFSATGEKQMNEKAKGVITIYNEYSSKAQPLVANTRILASGGKLFRTIESVEIPGASIEEGKIIASILDVEVTADQPGDEYNISPSDFTIPGFEGTAKYAGFYGKSKEAMKGGSTKKIKIVTADDIKKAEEALTKELLDSQAAKKALDAKMPADLKLIEEATKEEIASASSNIEAEKEAQDGFTMQVTAQAQALVFNEKDLNDLVDSYLAAKIGKEKKPIPQSQKISWDKPSIDWDKTSIFLTLHGQEEVAENIDAEAVKKELAGKNETEARKYLSSLTNIEKAQVAFWPFWVKHIPSNQSKIKVIIQ